MNLFKNACFLLLLFFWGGCELINPAEEIPGYVYLKEFIVEENPSVNHGSLSHKITTAYVFVGGDFLGVYNLPARVPVYGEGELEVLLDPSIRLNGIFGQVEVYPFYDRMTTTANVVPGQIDTIQPVTRYKDGIRFRFVENFDFGGNLLIDDRDGDTETKVDFTTEDVFEGARSGIIVLIETTHLSK